MLENQTQEQLERLSALVDRVLESIAQLREDLSEYQEALPVLNKE